jgi:hypothetical protein
MAEEDKAVGDDRSRSRSIGVPVQSWTGAREEAAHGRGLETVTRGKGATCLKNGSGRAQGRGASWKCCAGGKGELCTGSVAGLGGGGAIGSRVAGWGGGTQNRGVACV